MITICLTKFTSNPWENVVMKGFLKALKQMESFCSVEEIFGYPKKYYDLIILVGIRPVVKRNLDRSIHSNVAFWSDWRPICSRNNSWANLIVTNTTLWSQN